MGGISVWQLLIVAVIIVLLFGTKRLGTLGGDLGKSIKDFQNAMKSEKSEPESQDTKADSEQASLTENSDKK